MSNHKKEQFQLNEHGIFGRWLIYYVFSASDKLNVVNVSDKFTANLSMFLFWLMLLYAWHSFFSYIRCSMDVLVSKQRSEYSGKVLAMYNVQIVHYTQLDTAIDRLYWKFILNLNRNIQMKTFPLIHEFVVQWPPLQARLQ